MNSNKGKINRHGNKTLVFLSVENIELNAASIVFVSLCSLPTNLLNFQSLTMKNFD